MITPVICSAAHRCPCPCPHGTEEHEFGNGCYTEVCEVVGWQRVQCVPVFSHAGGDDEAVERVRAAMVGERGE